MSRMDPNHERLLKLVREARRELGLEKQKDFVTATGLGRTTIHRFESGEHLSDTAYRSIDWTLHWTAGSCAAVLAGGDPTPLDETPPNPADAEPTEAGDPYQLSGRLPASVLDELAAGEVYATDIHDLSQDGGITLITVAVRRPGEPGEQISPEQRRRNFRAWSRIQRQLNGLPPLEWEPGDPEEWKEGP